MPQRLHDHYHLPRFALVALSAIAIASSAVAQPGRVAGTVTDENGRPIRGATVKAESPASTPSVFTATTDDKGRFSILGLQKGTWRFTASAPGYEPSQGRGEVSAQKSNPAIEFRLFKSGGGPPRPLAGVNARELQGEIEAAEALLNAKQYDQAIAAYQSVLARAPSLTLVNLQIGNAHRLKKDYDRALSAYGQVLKTDPTNEQARINIGITNLEKGDLKAADETLAGIASGPSAGREAFYYLGEVKRAQGQADEAARWYQKAADADPAWARPVLRLGDMATEGNNGEAAIRFYEKVIALNPDSAEAAEARSAIERIRK
jgi:tetratricopeptide (TPR) repeat protein